MTTKGAPAGDTPPAGGPPPQTETVEERIAQCLASINEIKDSLSPMVATLKELETKGADGSQKYSEILTKAEALATELAETRAELKALKDAAEAEPAPISEEPPPRRK